MRTAAAEAALAAGASAAPPAADAACRRAAASRLAGRAVSALLDEVHLSPKPGLVDRRGSGAHRDLDLDLMCRSARTLGPWFGAMAEAAFDAGAVTPALRHVLGRLGRDAESDMLDTTRGVNTHRGAIWALGLLVAGAAIDAGAATRDAATRDAAAQPGAPAAAVAPTATRQRPSPSSRVVALPQAAAAARGAALPVARDGHAAARRIAALAGAVARLPDPDAPAATGSKGETACRLHGVGGARGQARAGFPHVVGAALPALARARARGDGETAARLDALVALVAVLDDTCVLSRAGRAGLDRLQAGAAVVLAAGGTGSLAGRRALRALDAEATALGASPGGAADLLAAALFLDRCA